jgi:acyl carrier protein
MKDILDRVRSLLTTRFAVTDEEFHGSATLAELDLDSLALVEFGLAAEQEFGVRVSEDEVSPDDTIDHLVSLIAAKCAGLPADDGTAV